jgi:hypothetical protein
MKDIGRVEAFSPGIPDVGILSVSDHMSPVTAKAQARKYQILTEAL